MHDNMGQRIYFDMVKQLDKALSTSFTISTSSDAFTTSTETERIYILACK